MEEPLPPPPPARSATVAAAGAAEAAVRVHANPSVPSASVAVDGAAAPRSAAQPNRAHSRVSPQDGTVRHVPRPRVLASGLS